MKTKQAVLKVVQDLEQRIFDVTLSDLERLGCLGWHRDTLECLPQTWVRDWRKRRVIRL